MNPFIYSRVSSSEAAVHAVTAQGAKFLGGGTNLVDLMKNEVEHPTALMDEVKRGDISVASWESGKTVHPALTDAESKERMAGNICRCGAYPNIVAAVRQLAGKGSAA